MIIIKNLRYTTSEGKVELLAGRPQSIIATELEKFLEKRFKNTKTRGDFEVIDEDNRYEQITDEEVLEK